MSVLWDRLTSTPWAITEAALQEIVQIATRANLDPGAVAQRVGRPLDNTYDVEYRDGVAVLPVRGPLFRYANLFTDVSGATSYETLARDFAAALNNDAVEAIALNVDSPGGQANGTSEFAEQIYASRGVKPIVAYVGGAASSAAYWIAAAADEIVVDDLATVGGIGAVTTITDTSERDRAEGIRRYEIVSAQSPRKRPDPSTAEGQSQLQEMVDNLASVFIERVARNRGVSADTVLSDFGQGGEFVGQWAVDAGLADSLGSYEGVITAYSNRAGDPGTAFVPAAGGRFTSGQEKAAMSEAKKDPAGGIETPEIDKAYLEANHPELVKTLRAEGAQAKAQETEAASAAEVETAVTAERERITSILASDAAAGREGLARELAATPGLSVEAAERMLGAAPKEAAGSGWLTQMQDIDPGLAPASQDDETAAVERSAQLAKSMGIE